MPAEYLKLNDLAAAVGFGGVNADGPFATICTDDVKERFTAITSFFIVFFLVCSSTSMRCSQYPNEGEMNYLV